MKAPNIDKDGDGYNDNTALLDCKKMFKWAFANMKLATVADTSTYVCELPVKLSADADHIRVVPAEKVNALVPSGVDESSVNFETDLPDSVNAPIKKGEKVGHAKIMYADSVVAEVDLVSGDDVKANALMFVLNLIKTVLTSPIFLTVLAVAGVGAGVYIYIVAHKGRKKVSKYKQRIENRIDDEDDDETIIRKSEADSDRIKSKMSRSAKKKKQSMSVSDFMSKAKSTGKQLQKNITGLSKNESKAKKDSDDKNNKNNRNRPAPPSAKVGDEDEFDFSLFE